MGNRILIGRQRFTGPLPGFLLLLLLLWGRRLFADTKRDESFAVVDLKARHRGRKKGPRLRPLLLIGSASVGSPVSTRLDRTVGLTCVPNLLKLPSFVVVVVVVVVVVTESSHASAGSESGLGPRQQVPFCFFFGNGNRSAINWKSISGHEKKKLACSNQVFIACLSKRAPLLALTRLNGRYLTHPHTRKHTHTHTHTHGGYR